MLGGIELGGTKCICVLGTGPEDIRAQVSIPTGTDPQVTLSRLEQALREAMSIHGPIGALGIASFGPVDLAPTSPTYGYITSTPKAGWAGTPIAPRFASLFAVPVGFDTDVNGAALAEERWGAARGLADFAYVTVGTGVGVGLFVNRRLAHGFLHPELGHIRVARSAGDDWPGACAYHGDCVEGLASGPAISARTGIPADLIPAGNEVWNHTAHALAQLLHTLVLATAPRRILVGGGVMQGRPWLFVQMRRMLAESLNGYVRSDELTEGLDRYVVPPGLGAAAGALGALALAADVLG